VIEPVVRLTGQALAQPADKGPDERRRFHARTSADRHRGDRRRPGGQRSWHRVRGYVERVALDVGFPVGLVIVIAVGQGDGSAVRAGAFAGSPLPEHGQPLQHRLNQGQVLGRAA
jgi:hypothetical protein